MDTLLSTMQFHHPPATRGVNLDPMRSRNGDLVSCQNSSTKTTNRAMPSPSTFSSLMVPPQAATATNKNQVSSEQQAMEWLNTLSALGYGNALGNNGSSSSSPLTMLPSSNSGASSSNAITLLRQQQHLLLQLLKNHQERQALENNVLEHMLHQIKATATAVPATATAPSPSSTSSSLWKPSSNSAPIAAAAPVALPAHAPLSGAAPLLAVLANEQLGQHLSTTLAATPPSSSSSDPPAMVSASHNTASKTGTNEERSVAAHVLAMLSSSSSTLKNPRASMPSITEPRTISTKNDTKQAPPQDVTTTKSSSSCPPDAIMPRSGMGVPQDIVSAASAATTATCALPPPPRMMSSVFAPVVVTPPLLCCTPSPPPAVDMAPIRHKREYNHESFAQKLHRIVTDLEASGQHHIMCFLDIGGGLWIHDPNTFVESIMPKYFRGRTWACFRRQLFSYRFPIQKHGPLKGSFQNPFFV